MMSRRLLHGLRAFPHKRLVAPSLCRTFATTKKEESMMDIVKEYGVMTTVGLGSAILVSKELFMVNEEVLVLGIFSGVLFYGYVTLYDSISESAEEYKASVRAEQIQARDNAIATLTGLADQHKKYTQVSEEIKNMYETLEKTHIQYCDAVNKTSEQAVIDDIEAELQDLYECEGFIKSYQKDFALKKAATSLNTYLKETLPAKEKDAFFKNAVSMLEGKGAQGEDFVVAQFKKELESVLNAMNNKDEKASMAAIDAMVKSGELDLGAPAMRTVRKLLD